jgi:hypothetical protein
VARATPKDEPRQSYLPLIRSHLDRILTAGADVYGPERTPMWMASLDIVSGRYPMDAPIARVGRRVYREIAAPFGSTIYWDQPQMVACHAVSALTGDTRYARAADAYARAFLAKGIDSHGLFEWGNHRYYDAFQDKVIHFSGGPHEMRPIPGAWGLFWKVAPDQSERAIRAIGVRHLFDPATGGFNRHDDSKRDHAFIESGGIIAESLCWLAAKKKEEALADMALRVARFSFENRDGKTGLVENNATTKRWDKMVSTTEVGVWAGSLLRCADYSGRPEFVKMASDSMSAWLQWGFDKGAQRYYGQVRVKDGSPVIKEKAIPGPEEYWPGDYADPWNANFPAHDYPAAMAETCLNLYRRTRAPIFEEGIHRWARVICNSPAPATAANGRGAYAELFGRSIHFLTGAANATGRAQYAEAAGRLAGHAIAELYAHGMFRGHGGEDRYDAVDGVGYLLLALMYLERGQKADYLGFGF